MADLMNRTIFVYKWQKPAKRVQPMYIFGKTL